MNNEELIQEAQRYIDNSWSVSIKAKGLLHGFICVLQTTIAERDFLKSTLRETRAQLSNALIEREKLRTSEHGLTAQALKSKYDRLLTFSSIWLSMYQRMTGKLANARYDLPRLQKNVDEQGKELNRLKARLAYHTVWQRNYARACQIAAEYRRRDAAKHRQIRELNDKITELSAENFQLKGRLEHDDADYAETELGEWDNG